MFLNHLCLILGSYVGRNALDELDSAVSISFNLTGDKIYAGSKNMIRCFDVSSPGSNNYSNYPTSKTRKSLEGQKGIISCLSFNPGK